MRKSKHAKSKAAASSGTGDVVKFVGQTFSVLSLIALFRHAFEYGLSAPLHLIADRYETIIGVMLGWLEPYALSVLHVLSQHVLWFPVSLHPHWRHILVLFWLYVGNDVRAEFQRDKRNAAIMTLLFGGAIALITSILSGLSAIDAPNTLAIILPIAGFVLYQVARAVLSATTRPLPGMGWWKSMWHFAWRFPISDAMIGGTILLLGYYLRHHNVPVTNLTLFFLFIIGLAFRNILQVVLHVHMHRPADIDTNWRSYATAKHGIGILQVICGCIVFILCDSGLKLFGL